MCFNKELSDTIYEMYYNGRIGINSNCTICRKKAIDKGKEMTNGPVPIFHIGKNFDKNKKRLLLIGRVAYGWADEVNALWGKVFKENKKYLSQIQNDVEERSKELLYDSKIKYFRFINYALTEIYGDIDSAFDNIAITNYVHCNTASRVDNLPQKVRDYCSKSELNGFIHKEVEILKPTHIVVLTTDQKYLRYRLNEKWNVMAIKHPSSPGRSKSGFTNEISDFLKK